MTNDANVQSGNAVHDQPVAEQAATVEAAEPQESAAESPADPAVGNGSAGENSPLAAFRRARLNPTVDETKIKSIPSLTPRTDDTLASPEPAAAETAEKEPAHEDKMRTPVPDLPPERSSAAPVAVPPPVKELDAEMEAEIEAAMASGELDLKEVPSPKVTDEEAEHEAKPAEELLEAGQHLTGRIQSIHNDTVFLELGYRSPGAIPLRQFASGKKPEVGQRIEVVVERIAHDEGLIHLNLPRGLRRIAGNWESLSKGQIVDCLVNRTNKGGLEVTVGGLRAFLPSSQVELGFISDLTPYVGQKLRVEVVEVNPRKRNLVVSRRAYLQIERQELGEKFWQTVAVDQTYTGTVKTIKDYGAFVDLGGVDGFLHIGEMSWHRIKHPSEIVKEGQTIDVKVLSLDPEKKKIGLGMKQLVQNPWSTAADKYPANSTVTGTVTRIADFGAFVELEPGLEGLIHVSELDHKRVRHPGDVLKVHQVVTAQVLEIDVDRKRISLSLKALIARPEEKKIEEPVAAEPIQRKRKGPLKGGTGSAGPGGLFGNPTDFH